ALATYARAALNSDEDDEAERAAGEAVEVAREVGAVDAEADALTTLAVLVVDDQDRAAGLLADALVLARRSGDLSTELRTMYNLANNRYYAGDVARATEIGDEAVERARSSGMLWSTYAIEMLMLGHLFRFVQGDLSPGPVRTDIPEPLAPTERLMTLYAAVARGDDDAVERGRTLEAHWSRDGILALVGGGCTVDALTWRGELDEAVDLALRVIEHLGREWSDYFLGGIWLSALGLSALADAAAQERLLGRDHPDTLTSRNDMAPFHRDARRLDRTLPLLEATLRDAERALGPDHPVTLTSRGNLALAYRDARRPDLALPLLERMLADAERTHGHQHADTLTSRSVLALAYHDAGRLDRAIPLLESTLADRERLLGPDHPEALTSANNLGLAYRDAGRLRDAVRVLERVMADR
ncbi:tetratricopeptide repeat protein, partial [Cellulomonas septica]